MKYRSAIDAFLAELCKLLQRQHSIIVLQVEDVMGIRNLGLQAVEATDWDQCGHGCSERRRVVYPLRYHNAGSFSCALAKI